MCLIHTHTHTCTCSGTHFIQHCCGWIKYQLRLAYKLDPHSSSPLFLSLLYCEPCTSKMCPFPTLSITPLLSLFVFAYFPICLPRCSAFFSLRGLGNLCALKSKEFLSPFLSLVREVKNLLGWCRGSFAFWDSGIGGRETEAGSLSSASSSWCASSFLGKSQD